MMNKLKIVKTTQINDFIPGTVIKCDRPMVFFKRDKKLRQHMQMKIDVPTYNILYIQLLRIRKHFGPIGYGNDKIIFLLYILNLENLIKTKKLDENNEIKKIQKEILSETNMIIIY